MQRNYKLIQGSRDFLDTIRARREKIFMRYRKMDCREAESLVDVYMLYVGVRMDVYRVFKIKEKLRKDMWKLEELKQSAYSPSSANLSGMPKSQGFFADGGKTAKIASKIVDLESIILEEQIELVQAVKEMVLFIREIPDSRTRCIFTLRCLDGKSWSGVSRKMGNPEDTTEGVKKMFYRYYKKRTGESLSSLNEDV